MHGFWNYVLHVCFFRRHLRHMHVVRGCKIPRRKCTCICLGFACIWAVFWVNSENRRHQQKDPMIAAVTRTEARNRAQKIDLQRNPMIVAVARAETRNGAEEMRRVCALKERTMNFAGASGSSRKSARRVCALKKRKNKTCARMLQSPRRVRALQQLRRKNRACMRRRKGFRAQARQGDKEDG